MTGLPPPTPQESALREQWRTGEPLPPKRDKVKMFAFGSLALAAGFVVYLVATNPNKGGDDPPARRMTLVEAACGMLNDGRDREFVYDVMKDLAADHPLAVGEDESVAARAAVERAEAQGCG